MLEFLRQELLEDLNELFGKKQQFAVFFIESNGNRQVYSGMELKNAELELMKDLHSRQDGFYNQRIDEDFYLILIDNTEWGTLVLGAKIRAFFEVAEEFGEILLVGVPVTLLLVLLGGRILAGRAMQPVVAVAEATEKISLTNLNERLPEYKSKDEFGKLISTLNHMIERIEQGVKQVQQFTQDAAHELRTPLTILRGELELSYQRDKLPEDVRVSLQKSLDKAISMSKIVESLMLLAQSDTGNYSLVKTRFSLDQLITDITEDLRSLVNSRPISIKLNHNDKIQFMGDKQLIQRLLLNLCDNALMFTKEGHIELSLHASGDKVVIAISNTGIGIPEEELPYIFDRFYRIDKARTRTSGGSGLGLAICKWIVTAHGGSMLIGQQADAGNRCGD